MNSIPQHAVANGSGQSELDRAHETIVSMRVVKKSAGPPSFALAGPWAGSALPPKEAIRLDAIRT
jgi:hypothetical protein